MKDIRKMKALLLGNFHRSLFFIMILSAVAGILILYTGGAFIGIPGDPLAVKRPDAVYESVFTDSLIERRVTSWYHGYYLHNLPEDILKRYTEEVWRKEQRNFLIETGKAGIDGPFATWSLNETGETTLREMYTEYGMKFPYFAHHSGHNKPAMEAGAVFLMGRNAVACWDTHYMDVALATAGKWLKRYGTSPWLSSYIGRDEPLNYAAAIRYPAAVDSVNSVLKKQYNLKLSLSPGNPDKPWHEWPTDPIILDASPHDRALLRIAVWRWLNGQLYNAARRELQLVRRYAPEMMYFAYNRNAINIRDVIEKPVRHSLDFLDQAMMYDVTDGFSADPYPTANLDRDGRERALYHVGFVSKLVTDLAAGKPTKMILQGFKFHGRLPTRDNLREWISQAAKAGVTHLEWYTAGCPRFVWPEVYAEILRLSRLWKDLPELDIPKTSRIAVIFSNDSRAAINDDGLHAHYMLHVLLGEKLGTWFSFIGENHVNRGLQSLDNAEVIIAPQLSYVSRKFAELLIERVERGATLMVLDPDALAYDIDSGSLSQLRLKLLGVPAGESHDADWFVPTHYGRERFNLSDRLPLYPSKHGIMGRKLIVPEDARVLFEYEDGTPAVFSRSQGSGEVIVFGAMPFGNSKAAVNPSGWDRLFSAVCDERGIDRGLPLWRFLMPAEGGEIETFDLLMNRGE
jgi:hypothetical protein